MRQLANSEIILMNISHLMKIEGQTIDIWPFAAEALRVCPYKTDLSTSELIVVIELEISRKYISVAWQDRVEGRRLYWPVTWVITRLRRFTFDWPERFAQMTDPDVRKLRPYIELATDTEWCTRADDMRKRWLHPDELEPLPFKECDRHRCWCEYRTLSRGDLKRRALGNGDQT